MSPTRPTLLMLTLLLAACGRQTPPEPKAPAPAPATAPAHEQAGIDWFDGSVEDALLAAREENRPIFLYWGAQWCPPCNQIKSTIFVRPDFIARTRRFTPVYLDGDSDGAQRWGEHFGTAGYPTLIVLRPDGTELTRISSGMDAARYPEVLDLALARNRPAGALLQQALTEPAALAPGDWTLLSLYSWAADNGRSVSEQALGTTLLKLAEHCPEAPAPACTRLALLAAIETLEHDGAVPEDTDALLKRIVESPAHSRQNLTELQYHGADLLEASTLLDADVRAALGEAMRARMQAVFADDSLPIKQRLLTTRLLIDLAELRDETDMTALQELVRARAAWADAQAATPYERQSLIYNAAWYLHDVGLSGEALAMFEAELERAVSAHYYMSYLATIEEELGHPEQALAWSRRAWDAARGPATRTQWGTSHALALVRLAPDQVGTISDAVQRLLDEMAEGGDGFHQRSLGRMRRLDAALQQWAAGDEARRREPAAELRERLAKMCRADQDDAAACDTFV